MNFVSTELPGVWVIELEPKRDERGFFARIFDEDEFAEHGLRTRFVQQNITHSDLRGTLRGLHWQEPPHAEAKLIRCVRGAVFDVAVDLRPESPTRGRWVGRKLTDRSRSMIYVPEGFAHGLVTLVDNTEVTYLASAAYAPEAERGVRHDDPGLGIEWPVEIRVVSEKDRNWPDWRPTGKVVSA